MNITDLIQGAVASRTTRFAFELLPPLKGDGTRSVFGAIDPLMDFNPAYINVTFHREALKEDIRPDGSREWHIMRRRPGTVGISAAIRRKYDVEVVPHLIDLPGWGELIVFGAVYLIVGGSTLLKAGRNILHGQIFDENFLMCLATIGAFGIQQYPEAVEVILFYLIGS